MSTAQTIGTWSALLLLVACLAFVVLVRAAHDDQPRLAVAAFLVAAYGAAAGVLGLLLSALLGVLAAGGAL